MGMMDDVKLVLRRLNRYLKRGMGGRGCRGRSGTATVEIAVWEMAMAWPTDDGRRERKK